ncbi:hypothetical protein J3E72DRAFT_204937 [Bipolaris maydis]|nr:hypothetical protein BM1_00749 [Bipolaris maydis]KAJ6191972.1 hypothetical protein J3E72DRAFT_204937 [Bipolaris maydis]KAJ6276433.1 hypothetical protein J3E71DRAFT_348319 [Bipolaris maydis]KAJ6276582.1 hypothetical protein J3E71DRAFT_373273 [Bipolaris maydis]
MWAEIDRERKKVACGACIRGHRSSKCDHIGRVLLEVRKPGRPLGICPHVIGSSSCERIVLHYKISKVSHCACLSERETPTATVIGRSRISKSRQKSTAVALFCLDKAIQAGLNTQKDTSFNVLTPSETIGSNAPSPPSSASSTPRLLSAQNDSIPSHCNPNQAPAPIQIGGYCDNKVNLAPSPPLVQKKSCGSKFSKQAATNYQPNLYHVGSQFQYMAQPEGMLPRYQMLHPQNLPSNTPNSFGLEIPIYNHTAVAYHQNSSVPMSLGANVFMSRNMTTSLVSQHVPEHNYHCDESCRCFGCAAHPKNATMMEYVRVMAHLQFTGRFGGMIPPPYDTPTYLHGTRYGAELGQIISLDSISEGMVTPNQTQMSSRTSLDLQTKPNEPMRIPEDWQQSLATIHNPYQTSFLRNTDYIDSTTINEHHAPLKTEDTTDTSAGDSPSNNKHEDRPTLPPLSFFWNEMTFPGCSDASGTYQCGDGCLCMGCLTYGRNNGDHFEDISDMEQTNFPDFMTDLDFSITTQKNLWNLLE